MKRITRLLMLLTSLIWLCGIVLPVQAHTHGCMSMPEMAMEDCCTMACCAVDLSACGCQPAQLNDNAVPDAVAGHQFSATLPVPIRSDGSESVRFSIDSAPCNDAFAQLAVAAPRPQKIYLLKRALLI